MPARTSTLLLACLAVLLAGCGSATTQVAPTATVAAPATAPASAPASVAPSPAAVSASPSASPPPSPAAAAVPSASPATSPAGGVRIELIADGSEARYRAREQLAQISLPSEAVGSTRAVSGGITLGPNGAIVREQSKLAINLTTLQSDRSNRDRFIQRDPLQTSQFPTAELVPSEVSGLPFPLPTSGETTFKLLGDLTVRGITRPTTWDMTARFEGPEISGSGSMAFRFSEFQMSAPIAGPVVSVEDQLKLEIDFRARTAAAGAASAQTPGA